MSEKKLEGSFTLLGLVEGQLPELPDARKLLQKWLDNALTGPLHLHLEFDGDRFSLQPDPQPVPAEKLGSDPAEYVQDLLEGMLSTFPPATWRGLFSTLRSVEIAPGEEIQTIYLVTPEGRVETRRRVVDADTTSGEQGLTRKEKIRLAAYVVGVVVVLLAVSSIWVPYGDLFRNLFVPHVPVVVKKIASDDTAMAGYVALAPDKNRRKGQTSTLLIAVTRGKNFPAKVEDLDKAFAQPNRSLEQTMAIQAVRGGYARLEMYGAEGKFLGYVEVRIARLWSAESFEVEVEEPRGDRLEKLVLTY